MPQENDLISWTGSDPSGHTGFIAEVTFDSKSKGGWVYTVEQNWGFEQGLFAQPFRQNKDGTFTIDRRDGSAVQAWTRYKNQSMLSEGKTYTSILHTPAPKKSLHQPQP